MKKSKVFAALIAAIMCLGLVSIPKAFSQTTAPTVPTNIKVVSYTWYVNAAGDLIAVGEVQNTGTENVLEVTLTAAAYESGGTELVSSSGVMPYGSYLVQDQKAPFYVDFGNPGAGQTLTASSVSNIEFTVTSAPQTNSQQYTGLSIDAVYSGVEDNAYTVIGSVSNMGDQTATGIKVVGTFYNAAGTVVAVGFDVINGSLAPNNGTVFTVIEFDATATLSAEIANYSISAQTSSLQGGGTAPSGTPGSTTSSPSGIPDLIYIIIAGVIVVVVVAITALMYQRKRSSNLPLPPPPPPPPA